MKGAAMPSALKPEGCGRHMWAEGKEGGVSDKAAPSPRVPTRRPLNLVLML